MEDKIHKYYQACQQKEEAVLQSIIDNTRYRDREDFYDDCAVALSDGAKAGSIALYLSGDMELGTCVLPAGFASDAARGSEVDADHTYYRSLPGIKQYHDFFSEKILP